MMRLKALLRKSKLTVDTFSGFQPNGHRNITRLNRNSRQVPAILSLEGIRLRSILKMDTLSSQS